MTEIVTCRRRAVLCQSEADHEPLTITTRDPGEPALGICTRCGTVLVRPLEGQVVTDRRTMKTLLFQQAYSSDPLARARAASSWAQWQKLRDAARARAPQWEYHRPDSHSPIEHYFRLGS